MTTPAGKPEFSDRVKARIEWAQEHLDGLGSLIALVFLRLAVFLSIVVMVSLLGIGFRALYSAVSSLFHASAAHNALCEAVHGIEYFLLAPLGFLVINALMNYVATVLRLTPESLSEDYERKARAQLLTAKAFTVSLLAAAVATFLVGKVISDAPFELEQALAGCLVLVVLLVFLLIVERSAHSAHEKPDSGSGGPKPVG